MNERCRSRGGGCEEGRGGIEWRQKKLMARPSSCAPQLYVSRSGGGEGARADSDSALEELMTVNREDGARAGYKKESGRRMIRLLQVDDTGDKYPCEVSDEDGVRTER